MKMTNKLEARLTNFTHDLFLKNEYKQWRTGLRKNAENVWHSLIAGLHQSGAPLNEIKDFGENIYSKLVFSYIKAPDYNQSQMLMIQFTISGSMWHSVVWHCPERN